MSQENWFQPYYYFTGIKAAGEVLVNETAST